MWPRRSGFSPGITWDHPRCFSNSSGSNTRSLHGTLRFRPANSGSTRSASLLCHSCQWWSPGWSDHCEIWLRALADFNVLQFLLGVYENVLCTEVSTQFYTVIHLSTRVCVRTIWTDVKLLSLLTLSFTPICRGHAAIMQTHANEAMHDGGSRGWSPWCTCTVVITCCSGSASFVIYVAITACEWQPAKPRTGMSIVFSQIFHNFGYNFCFSFSVSLLEYEFFFKKPCPIFSGDWGLFARMIHSTSQFAMTILSKCVCVCHCLFHVCYILCAFT